MRCANCGAENPEHDCDDCSEKLCDECLNTCEGCDANLCKTCEQEHISQHEFEAKEG